MSNDPTLSLNDCRKKFEEWYLKYMGYPLLGLKPSSFCNRVYDANDTEYMYIGWKARNMYRDERPSEIRLNDEEQLVADIAADICDTVSRLNGIPYTPQQWMGTARNALKHFKYHSSPMREMSALRVREEFVKRINAIPLGEENQQRGASYYNWGRAYIAVLDEILAEMNLIEGGKS